MAETGGEHLPINFKDVIANHVEQYLTDPEKAHIFMGVA